jgi:succinate dehydrogenase / fumarate reductase iron-sulfur subunit
MEKEKRTIHVKIKRQDAQNAQCYWEEFFIPYRPNMNVIAVLMELRHAPETMQGKQTTPIAWEAACLEEVCGTCSMIINGKPRQACSALVDTLASPIVLEPFTKFPVIRDLIVDRSRMFEGLIKTKAWVTLDGTHDLGPGPKYPQELALKRYYLSECMTCGCCLEACPQYGPSSPFVGPQVINQVNLFNTHPTGSLDKAERLESVMGEGGITDCGDAQNCVAACPKKIPLTESIAEVSRDTTKHAFKKLFD